MTSVVLLPDPSTPLSRESAAQAFADILDARVSAEAIGDFLLALSDRGETSIEIAEAARALRARLIPIAAPDGAIDVCGTGGDGHHTLNVSTAVALVVAYLAAGAWWLMAVHGAPLVVEAPLAPPVTTAELPASRKSMQGCSADRDFPGWMGPLHDRPLYRLGQKSQSTPAPVLVDTRIRQLLKYAVSQTSKL